MIFFVVVFLNFSTECGLHKEVFDVIIFPFICQTINSPVSSFSTVIAFTVEAGLPCSIIVVSVVIFFLFPQQSDALWSYLPHLLNFPLKNLPFLLLRFFSPVFNVIAFSSGSAFPEFFSVQLFLPEPTYLFLQILRFPFYNIDIAGYSDWIVYLREDVKKNSLKFVFVFFILCFDIL